MSSPDHLGTGWSFPAGTDASGNAQLVSGITDIEQAIHLILATTPGERPMRPEFGCGIHSLIFAPVDATTAGIVEQEVRQALERWEPRAQIDSVTVTGDDSDDSLLHIDIRFRARGTNNPRNLVFPFYTIPAHVTEAS
ncbi:GPW/gp25 family protein (plasmid) [Streptomyces murinus]|uniref:GPW/gp25 family protein n=1 Tax=Streptomyces murinus TaxID=33900 RepID=UPI000A1FDF63|nr:GPW/gp25 family protein [Streptomyces murinus]WDO11325.1 GPW/gp25 family protein [Streptomyces murinus]